MSKNKSESVPSSVEPAFSAIVSLIDAVCNKHLNEEYAALSRRLAATLARKRPSPILRGKPEIWACAIVYAIGAVNFLFDKSQTPHMRADELCNVFCISQSSGANKAKFIRDTLNMYQLDPNWCLPSRVDDNPMIWILQVNGMMVDVRHMPREVQVIAYEKGLIPYIPADR
jgi:hypothetical protein